MTITLVSVRLEPCRRNIHANVLWLHVDGYVLVFIVNVSLYRHTYYGFKLMRPRDCKWVNHFILLSLVCMLAITVMNRTAVNFLASASSEVVSRLHEGRTAITVQCQCITQKINRAFGTLLNVATSSFDSYSMCWQNNVYLTINICSVILESKFVYYA